MNTHKVACYLFKLLVVFSLLFPYTAVFAQDITSDTRPIDAEAKVSEELLIANVFNSYTESKGLNFTPDSPEAETFFRDVLFGEYPDIFLLASESDVLSYAVSRLQMESEESLGMNNIYTQSDSDVVTSRSPRFEISSVIYLPLISTDSTTVVGAESAQIAAYNGYTAAAYANKWAENGKQIRNFAQYPSFSNDCTNFISQALQAGGYAQAGSGSCNVEDNASEWYVKKGGWACVTKAGSWAWSKSWSTANAFPTYAVANQGAKAYLIKRVDEDPKFIDINDLIYYSWPGDIIHLRVNGNIYHSMIVTKDRWVSRSNSDLLLTYHTGPENKDVEDKSVREIIKGLPQGVEVIFIMMP